MMKYLSLASLAIVVLLSLLAGGAKIMSMPQEVQFFAAAGIDAMWLLPLGILQAFGGLLAVFGRSRVAGSICMALGFLVSAITIYLTGNLPFALFSLLPVLLCGVPIWYSRKTGRAE